MERKLPLPGSQAARDAKAAWMQADHDGKTALAARLGVSRGTLANFVTSVSAETDDFVPEPYPPFHITPPATAFRAEEDIGVILADWHAGKQTPSYSIPIFRERVEYLTERLLNIIALHRPIRRMHVMFLGDMTQGENPYQGSSIESVSTSARSQIKRVLIPSASGLLLSCAPEVEAIEIYGVRGNHGRYDKTSPESTNWDLFFYDMLEMSLSNQPTIHVHQPTDFYQLINIRGWRFFIIHGDQVNATNGIPLFAMRRKMQDWYAHVGGFHYAYAGHFHSAAADQVNSVADYTLCPPLVTGDAWALEKVGRASKPVQLCFGIHNKYGRTWEYRLYADEKYLPVPFEEPEGVISVTA